MKRFRRPMKPLLTSLLLVLSLALRRKCPAWGEAHGSITRAAIKELPAWQRELLGKEGKTRRLLLRHPGHGRQGQGER